MILLLFIICIVNLITFYNVDYKYYKEHGEWNDHSNTYGGTFRNLTAACVTFAIAVALLLDKYLAYIIHSGFISGYQNRYGDNLKPPTNVYHRMTA